MTNHFTQEEAVALFNAAVKNLKPGGDIAEFSEAFANAAADAKLASAGAQSEREKVICELLQYANGVNNSFYAKELSRRAAALLEAQPKREPMTDVMTWNEMYQRLDFLNGRPIAAYSASELMQIENRELRKALKAAHKIGGQG